MNTPKHIRKVVWAAIALFMVSSVALSAATDTSRDKAYGKSVSQQSETASQQGETASQQQQQWSGRQMTTQAGVLCGMNDLLGSDVKSKSMSSTSETMTMGQDTMDKGRSGNSDKGRWENTDKDRSKNPAGRGEQESSWMGQSKDSSDSQVTLGTVSELILDDQQDEIRYVILQSDNQLYPVPWDAFHVKKGGDAVGRSGSSASGPQVPLQSGESGTASGSSGFRASSRADSSAESSGSSKPRLYLPFSKEQLQQAPSISASVQAVSRSQLQQQIDSFYAQYVGQSSRPSGKSPSRQAGEQDSASQWQAGRQTPAAGNDRMIGNDRSTETDFDRSATASTRLRKATDVIGLKLQNKQGQTLGTIDDLVVDTREGQVAYGLVSYGGILNIGSKVAAVPWTSLTLDAGQQYAQIDASEDQLDKAELDDGNIERLSESQFASTVHDTFDAEPYWGVYGYVPGQDEDDASDSTDRDSQQKDRERKQHQQQQKQRNQGSQTEQPQQSEYDRY